MADFPSLPLWTDAYLADTRHLSTVEHGAYLLLLMEAWRRPSCSLPDDDRLLARLAGLSDDEWLKIKGIVLDFWQYDGRRKEWRQLRLVKERDFLANQSRSQRDRVLKRWNKKENTHTGSIPDLYPDDTQKIPPHPHPIKDNSLRSLSKKTEKNGTRIPDDFEPDREWSRKQGLTNSELRFEFEQFKDFWKAKSGKDATKKDWQATWRTWIRNAAKRRGRSTGPTTIAGAAAAALEEKRNDQFSFDAMEREQGQSVGRSGPALPPLKLALPKLPE